MIDFTIYIVLVLVDLGATGLSGCLCLVFKGQSLEILMLVSFPYRRGRSATLIT